MSEACYRYKPRLEHENDENAKWLMRLTTNFRNWGFGLCYLYLRNVKGFLWNHKRIYRIYRELELNLRIKPRKRIVREKPEALKVPEGQNQSWSMDFMHDSLADNRSYRLFNVIDDFNREALGMEIDISLPAERVIRVLEQIIEWRGKPQSIRCDNGPEYVSSKLKAWALKNRIGLSVERFNRTVRYDWLNQDIFDDIEEVQEKATIWLWHYNNERPNMALGGITPRQKLMMAA